MPFKSQAQKRFMFAKHPEIAKRWAKEYPESLHVQKEKVSKNGKLGARKK